MFGFLPRNKAYEKEVYKKDKFCKVRYPHKAQKYRSLKIGANVSYSSKKKKAIQIFISNGYLNQFFKHLGRKNGLDNKAYGIGDKEGCELHFVHDAICAVPRIKKQKKENELQKTTSHEQKADIVP
jgi:hypothetical protein